MGSSKSKVEQINKTITDVTTEVMINISTNCPVTVQQDQEVYLSGNAEISNLQLEQTSKINIKCMQKADFNAKFQSDLVAKILNKVQNTNSENFSPISRTKSVTKITNIIKNNVATHFNINAITTLNVGLQQKQVFSADGYVKGNNISLTQAAVAIVKLVNDFMTNLSTELRQGTNLSNDAIQKNKSMIDSVMDGMNKIMKTLMSLFNLGKVPIYMSIACAVACCAIILLVIVMTILKMFSR